LIAKVAAERLPIHVNTAHHRLGRVAEKTSDDLRRLADCDRPAHRRPAGRPMNEPFFVRAGGLRLRVARQGAGRPLLLITGIGAFA
jgi:PucR C-terminal helix-turn-helix domain